MHFHLYLKASIAAAVLSVIACHGALAQEQSAAASGAAAETGVPKVHGALGIPARATPNDYQSHAQAGSVTIAADFAAHGVPTPEATFSTEDYVVVEVGFFGAPGARLNVNYQDFSLIVNGKKKAPLASQPYALVFKSLKDPSWIPPETEQKSKTSIGGGGGNDDPPPAPPKMPFAMRRTMEQRVEKASLPEGERPLPQDGLLYFEYRGKPSSIHSLQLIYNGPAGKATLPLQ
jgi:hypothetical protein